MTNVGADVSGTPEQWETMPPSPDTVGDRATAATMRNAALGSLRYAESSWRRLGLSTALAAVPPAAVIVELVRRDATGLPQGGSVLAGSAGGVVQLLLACVGVSATIWLLVLHQRRRQRRRRLDAWDQFGFDPRIRALPQLPAPTPRASPPRRGAGWLSRWLGSPPVQQQTMMPAPVSRDLRALEDWRLSSRLLGQAMAIWVLGLLGIVLGAFVVTFAAVSDRTDGVTTAAMICAGAVPVVNAVGGLAAASRHGLVSVALERRSDVAGFVSRARADLSAARTSTPGHLELDERSAVWRNVALVLPLAIVTAVGAFWELDGVPLGVWVGLSAAPAATVLGWFAWSRWRRHRLLAQAVRRGLLRPHLPAVLARSVRDDSHDHERPHVVASVDVPADVLDAVRARTYVVQTGNDGLVLVDGRRRVVLDKRQMLGAALVPGARASRLDVALLWPQGETLILSTLQRGDLVNILHAAALPLAPLHVEGLETLMARQRDMARFAARRW